MTGFDWSDYLTVARDLDAKAAPSCGDDARWRAAISRAYYAAFCPARDLLINEGALSPSRRDEPSLHMQVAARFKSDRDGRRVKIGRLLFGLRERRNEADYENVVLDLQAHCLKALSDAAAVHELLAKL